jgi:hypothetical protein
MLAILRPVGDGRQRRRGGCDGPARRFQPPRVARLIAMQMWLAKGTWHATLAWRDQIDP